MLKTVIRTAAIVAIAASQLTPTTVLAETSIDSVPPELMEVMSGGAWSEGGKGGIYRAVALLSENGAIDVYLQWLAYEQGKPVPVVLQSVPFKEANEQKLQNAFVTIEAEKDNEVFITVDSYDPIEDKDISITAKATAPGQYEVVKTPPRREAPPEGEQ